MPVEFETKRVNNSVNYWDVLTSREPVCCPRGGPRSDEEDAEQPRASVPGGVSLF